MPREFELRKEVALDATPEQVWEAIATGPGITAWFMPHEVEPGVGGVVRLRLGEYAQESTITTWEPPHRARGLRWRARPAVRVRVPRRGA
jgi:Uncharacterized conserved protein